MGYCRTETSEKDTRCQQGIQDKVMAETHGYLNEDLKKEVGVAIQRDLEVGATVAKVSKD